MRHFQIDEPKDSSFPMRILNLLTNVDLSSLPHRILVATLDLWVAAWLVGETTTAATGYPGTVG
jgi:hypothetical protein